MNYIIPNDQIEPSQHLQQMVANFVTKTAQRRKLEAESKKLGEELTQLGESLVDLFALSGIQNVKTTSGHTVYLNREVFAKLTGDLKKAYTALRRAGLGEFIKEGVNASKLKSYVREVQEMDEAIPKGLQPYIDITEVFRIRMRSN
jgi:hypothetical protein